MAVWRLRPYGAGRTMPPSDDPDKNARIAEAVALTPMLGAGA